MSTRRYSSEYKALQPFVIEDIRRILGGNSSNGVNGSASIAAHALADTSIHAGQLAQAQANWAATKTQLTTHASNPDAHHARQHAITGTDHTATGSQYQIVGLTAANTLGLLTPSASPGAASAILRTNAGALTLSNLTISAAGYLYLDGTLDFGVNTLYEDATYLQVTGSKAVRFGQNIGNANWTIYNAGGAMFSGNVELTGNSDLSVAGSGFYAGSPVLFVDSSGGNVGILCNPDPQFALDVAGPARAQYFVGPHAIQLKGALLIAHYDGPQPVQTNFSGEPNGHMGQTATVNGTVLYRPGKFGKAVQVGPPATNLCPNPSFEANSTGWTLTDANGSASMTRTPRDSVIGSYSLRILNSTAGEDDHVSCTVAVTPGATYTVSAYVRALTGLVAGAVNNYALGAYYSADFGATFQATTLTVETIDGVQYAKHTTDGEVHYTSGEEWVRHSVTLTIPAGGGGNLVVRLYAPRGQVYWDAVQVEASAIATGYTDSTMPARTANSYLTYKTKDALKAQRGAIMAWVMPYAASSIRSIVYAAGTTAGAIQLRNNGYRYEAQWGTEIASAVGAAHPGKWTHLAMTCDGVTLRLYVNGVEAATAAGTGFSGMPETFLVGTTDAGSGTFDGLIDDLVILDRAPSATEILTIYESNAPVFAESSVWSFRATPAGLVWADNEGLWMKDVAGNPVLGVYGGEATTKSWGGFTLSVGDVVIGRNAVGAAALMWDQSTGKFGWYGGGNSTPQVEISTLGEIVAGAGRVKMGSYGLAVYRSGGSSAAGINEDGFWLDKGGSRTSINDFSSGSRVHSALFSEFYEADSETFTYDVSTFERNPLIIRNAAGSYVGDIGTAYVELSAYYSNEGNSSRIILNAGAWSDMYSVKYGTAQVIELDTAIVAFGKARLWGDRSLYAAVAWVRLDGTVGATNAISAAALGAYAGKIKVNINGTDRWIPYYA